MFPLKTPRYTGMVSTVVKMRMKGCMCICWSMRMPVAEKCCKDRGGVVGEVGILYGGSTSKYSKTKILKMPDSFRGSFYNNYLMAAH